MPVQPLANLDMLLDPQHRCTVPARRSQLLLGGSGQCRRVALPPGGIILVGNGA